MNIFTFILSGFVMLGGTFTVCVAASSVENAISPEATYAAACIGLLEVLIGGIGMLYSSIRQDRDRTNARYNR